MGPSQTDRSWPELKTCWRRAPGPCAAASAPLVKERVPDWVFLCPWAVWLIFLGRVAHGQPSDGEERFPAVWLRCGGSHYVRVGSGRTGGLRLPAGTDPDPTRNRSGDLPEPHRTGYIDAESAAKARGAASLDPGQQALACAEPYWRTALAAPLSGALHCAITQEPRG